MTEKEFFEAIKQRTEYDFENPKEGLTFGFVMGTQCPFTDYTGMQSAMRRAGYRVWRKIDGVTMEKDFIAKDSEGNLEEVIEFLNKKLV